MILTIDEAIKNIDGYFYLYQYNCIVTREIGSEHFGCFKGNDLKSVTVPCFIFCHSDKDFDYIMDEWNNKCGGMLSMYRYEGVGRVEPIFKGIPEIKYVKGFQAVQYIYEVHNFKYLANLLTIGSREYIQ